MKQLSLEDRLKTEEDEPLHVIDRNGVEKLIYPDDKVKIIKK